MTSDAEEAPQPQRSKRKKKRKRARREIVEEPSAKAPSTRKRSSARHGADLGLRIVLTAVLTYAFRGDADWGIAVIALGAALVIHGAHGWLMDVWTPTAPPLQRSMLGGGILTIVGLAMVGTHATLMGAVLVLLGWLSLMYSIHLFGRLGPRADA